ncbi:MAG: hypothetical protein AAFM92_03095 [Pseudomonadota bacterium]
MKHALYRHYDAEGALLYVGITCDLECRTSEHASRSEWASEVARTVTEYALSREHALALENVAITFEQPKYNVQQSAKPEEEGLEGRQLIDALGKDFFVEVLGITDRNFRHIRQSRKIPAMYFAAVLMECSRRGVKCSPHAFTGKSLA